ncbi:MAG: hypothetical protein JXR95_08945 [Deltaproteobacteria bacterium]|nr:hypothetical protein [Deltaproteobacteria bacterium]
MYLLTSLMLLVSFSGQNTKPQVKSTGVMKDSGDVDIVVPFVDAVKSVKKNTVEKKESDFKISWSGFVWLDTRWSSNELFHLDSPLYVKTPENDRGSALGFTARTSRITMKIDAPDLFEGVKNKAVFEVDFYGNLPSSGTSIRQPMPRMRLAYAEFVYGGMTVHAGNDWMVAAPQFSSTLDPFNLWGQGNLWMRYPQIKGLYKFRLSKIMNIEGALSAGNSMGGDGPKNTMLRDGGVGEFSSIPVVQSRLALNFLLGEGKWSTIGISGSYQKLDLKAAMNSDGSVLFSDEDVAILRDLGKDEIPSWFGAVDMQLNWSFRKWNFKGVGEYHYGQSIASYWGGILQNYDIVRDSSNLLTDISPIKSMGYFGDLTIESPWGVGMVGGYGVNFVDEDDLYTSSRLKNTIIYGNIFYKRKALFTGLGLNYMKTDYTFSKGSHDAFNIHLVIALKF